ncbi:MAG: DAK2 domain-containing protein [Lachnospiraceae bacterium]|nr:DAK2 domain-containing protein [Lachnospiraceae bacterium]
MVIKTIDAAMIQKMFLAGANNIEAKKEYINELNVFPVPDGDTGTNMSLTIMAAAREVDAMVDPTIKDLCKAISSGSLRGARGNSGVILSQLFRGFTKELADAEVVDVTVLANAVSHAADTAYKAVMKPKEGTILTVARGAATRAMELVSETDDIVYFTEEVLKHMKVVLDDTPNMLPVLKTAGVVDSGGQGLVEVIEGCYCALIGKEIDTKLPEAYAKPKNVSSTESVGSDADIKFGYCTEFIIMLEKKFDTMDENKFKKFLGSIGDSIVCVADDDIVKIHVHTNDPGLAIQKGLSYGSLTRMKIDNMREEHNERFGANAPQEKKEEKPKADEPRKNVGFIAVSIGEGINDMFKELGVDYIIKGGQTMNPSTEDMLNAIDSINADNIFIFPNNGNVILAAEQAKTITEDKNIIVVPTKTVTQGISAMISYVADNSIDQNLDDMMDVIANVKTGQVTYAVRDTEMDGKKIKENDIMGIGDKVIEVVGQDIETVTFELTEKLVSEDSEIISIFYGEDMTQEDAEALSAKLEEKYPDIDIEVYSGGQPIYYYIVAVE